MRGSLKLLCWLALAATTACSRGPHPSFVKAESALSETMARTGDLSYGHPDFDEVEQLLRAVPEDANEHAVAQQLAEQIRAARKTYEAEKQLREAERARFKTLEAEAKARAHAEFSASKDDGPDEARGPQDEDENAPTAGPSPEQRLENVLKMRKERVRRFEQKERERRAHQDEQASQFEE